MALQILCAPRAAPLLRENARTYSLKRRAAHGLRQAQNLPAGA
jgi:hypothetical protein